MSDDQFEYEERYRVNDPEATQRTVESAGFVLASTESQVDHWFIPKSIMTSDEQSEWFDNQHGYALRIREEVSGNNKQTFITAKQLLKQGDHSAMTNNEALLTASGMQQVLRAIGDEFAEVLAKLDHWGDQSLAFTEAKELIESVGRKEYITLDKQRRTFRNAGLKDIVIDLDVIPALEKTALGFWASMEIEYTGDEDLKEAQAAVRRISTRLGYKPTDILKKALPGLAIPHLAYF